MGKIRNFILNNLDRFTLALIGTVILAAVLPVHDRGYEIASIASKVVVAFLFFLHGVKLSPQSLWAGLTHWKLHLVILGCTFVMFPILGLLLKPVLTALVGQTLYLGMLFICVLPSTVQSSIAFTSLARGNVAAAICAASASSILGVVITPLLVGLVLGTASGGFSTQAVIDLFWQLVAPFAAGQVLRPCLAPFVSRHKSLIGYVDRTSVLFIVYVSFSHGTTSGLWGTLSLPLFLALAAACGLLLGLALLCTGQLGKRLGFDRADRITILFCGSKKSLVTGVPMANIIFPAAMASTIILPLMVFHQMQLMVCAQIARKAAKDTNSD
ncbi:bile acid:sodium symporter [Deltaproteobacteria bacterium Smac51]|nr:bile acid:sodium symporter [Deltaproteobacteria bacterium Smac51]